MVGNCYRKWPAKDFKKDFRVTRATFNFILDVIVPYIFKKPTNLNPEPISVGRQLGLVLCRLGHGVPYSTLSQLFDFLISLASKNFIKACRVLVAASYDKYVTLPKAEEEWKSEVKGFIENYEFPCVGAWDGFHVYVSSKLTSFYSFKKRYSMSNLGLAGYLYCGFGAPGSMHDSRMLRSTSLYEKIISGNINNGLRYAAQSLYLCKGSMFTPLATSSKASWSDKESLRRKGRCFIVEPIESFKLAMEQLSSILFLHDI